MLPIEEFEKLVGEGIDAIPQKFQRQLDNVAVVVEVRPSDAKMKKLGLNSHSLLFGLYEGIPQAKRGMGYSGVLPDKITIYQEPIERVCGGSEAKIKAMVQETVYHEIAHHFGTNEERVRQIEMRHHKEGKI